MDETLVLRRAYEHATRYVNRLNSIRTGVTATPRELATFEAELTDEGIPAERVIDELVQSVEPGLIGSASGRFFGWVIGGTLPAALSADWLASTWDENAALYACSPPASIVEDIAGKWLKDLLNVPQSASVAFVTGCQMAHFTSLAAARHKLLADRSWNVEVEGLAGAPRIEIATSGARHESLIRAARFAGLGSGSVIEIAAQADGKMDPLQLKAYLESRGSAPTIVVLQAGDINTGQFDNFEELCEIAHRFNAWVHVDGAFGLWAATSEKYKHLLAGCEKADSWATDGHKWLNVPFDSGFAFIAHAESHRAAMTTNASYLIANEEVRDQINWNPDWSRRARGYAVYAALRNLGRHGVADMIERSCEHARSLVSQMAALSNVEVLAEPIINQGLVRFLSPDGDHDRKTNEVIARVQEQGEAWFGGTTWRGQRAMRISVINFRTNEDDVNRSVASVKQALEVCDRESCGSGRH
jgi:glutamate/tyrosine decarboxylase-like PLP-dependent enzyme